MADRRLRVRVGISLALVALLVGGAIVAEGGWVLLPLALSLGLVLWRAPEVLPRLVRWRTGLLLLLFAGANVAWRWGPGGAIPGAGPSGGWWEGLWMSARALTILVTMTGLTATVSIGDLTGLLRDGRWRMVGFMVGVAVNLLPLVQQTLTNSLQALRLRGGFRRRRWRALQLLATSVVTNLLQHADDIVCSAQARALMAPTSPPDRPPP